MKRLLRVFPVICLAAAVLLTGCSGGRLRLDPSLKNDIVLFGGHQYLPLARACDAYGIACGWDPYARTATLKKGPYTVVALADCDTILVNGVPKRLGKPVLFTAGTLYVPVSLVGRDLMLMLPDASAAEKGAAAPTAVPALAQPQPQQLPPQQPAGLTVVLDSGHGGRDVGAIGRHQRLQEKDYALAVAKKVRRLLEKSNVRVVMTRDSDVFIPLPDRAAVANRLNVDLFVSIHINSSRARFMRGFECYYLSDAADDNARALEALENSSLKLSDAAGVEHSTGLDKTLWDLCLTENRKESAGLAEAICDSIDGSVSIENRGVKTANFYVLRHTSMPSVLVEVCYLSNREDEMKLRNGVFQDRVAEAVARGILRHRKDFEKTEGFTNI